MSQTLAKARPAGAGNEANPVASSTNRLVAQVISRIPWLPVVTVGLILLLAGVALLYFFRAGEAAREADFQDSQARLYETMEQVVQTETVLLGQTLLGQNSAFEAAKYRNNFETAFNKLKERDAYSYAILDTHSHWLRDFQEGLGQPDGSPQTVAIRLQLWQNNQALFEQLEQQAKTFRPASRQALDNTRQTLDQGFWSISGLLILAVGVVMALLRFLWQSVLRPLNYLNNHLLGLLWSQTEHLTQHLNTLQAQINADQQRLVAVNHDLKSPLGNVKALAEVTLLTNPGLREEVSKNLKRIAAVADQGAGLLDQSLSRPQFQPALQKVNLQDLLEKVLQLVDLRNFKVRQEVELTEATLDPHLLEHLLLNLVSNARKFSAGGIRLGTRLVAKPGTMDELEVELWVWNDGVAISLDKRSEIFKPGYQTPDGKKAGGHGLGLSIVKTIAEQHYGRVLLESHEKIGTTFRVVLPYIAPISFE